MISPADHVALNLLFIQPAIEGAYFLQVKTGVHEVTSVDENIAVWNVSDQVVRTVSIGNNDQARG